VSDTHAYGKEPETKKMSGKREIGSGVLEIRLLYQMEKRKTYTGPIRNPRGEKGHGSYRS